VVEPVAGMTERQRLPAGIWALGLVSLFMDVSSEMIHALLPVFLVTVLGASAVTVGLIEGIGEATASFSKLFSGWLSDRLGRRKLLIVAGYGLGALSKPLFALAPGPDWVLFARFSDRVGKGIRGAPRDALIGDLVTPEMTGAAYGLRQSLDTVGAFIGPLLAIVLMMAFAGDFRAVFWIAVIPGLIAVAILVIGVREPERHAAAAGSKPVIQLTDVRHLGAPFWGVVGIGAALTLARFSEAFLVLRANDAGLALSLVPLVLVVMNVVFAVSAYPVGVISDRLGRHGLLAAGFAVLILADLVLAIAPGLWAVLIGVALWGLHMGMTQGVLAALVSDSAPATLRGSAFGVFHLVTGLATLLASVIAGALWTWVGPAGTFLGGALFTIIGLAGMIGLTRRPESNGSR